MGDAAHIREAPEMNILILDTVVISGLGLQSGGHWASRMVEWKDENQAFEMA